MRRYRLNERGKIQFAALIATIAFLLLFYGAIYFVAGT